MSDIRSQIASLTPEQRKLFAERLRQDQPPAPPSSQAIPRRPDLAAPPLSFAQQRMWLLDQLEPGNPLYTMTPTMRLSGPLDPAALAWALNTIVRRHATLRARFPAVEGRPVQQIAPQLHVPLPVIDLRAHAAAAREAEAQRLIDSEVQSRFDLATGPLIRAQLLRLAEAEHILTVTMHHIISDGWSLGVLIKELVALYVAHSAGAPSPLPDLPIQYGDYAQWQRERLHGALLERQLAYWRSQLADTPILQLPTDHARPVVQTYRSAQLPLTFSPALTAGLKELSRRVGATLFMTQLAAFAALLGRLSGQRDFCVGTLVAGRNHPELEGLIGFFINNLALRMDLSGRPTVAGLLQRVRATTLGSYDRQDVPFEAVLEALNPTRNTSHPPLFQVMCSMQNFPRPQELLPGLVLQPVYTASRRSGFDLTFWAWEHADSLVGELEYNPTLFEPATIARIGNHLRTLLTQFVADSGRALADLALLTPVEQRQILLDWNATAAPFPHDSCIHELFEQQAARSPDATALVDDAALAGSAHLTYAALNRRANQLAHRLRGLGVGAGACVGLCLPRSLDLLIGAFGILKAGSAYVPLDPTYPAARLALMIEQARIGALVTRRTIYDALGSDAGAPPEICGRPILLDSEWTEIARERQDNPAAGATADALMYVIYTSGSTGRPKGAGVYHRGFANLIHWFAGECPITADDQVLLLTSFSFDLTQKNVFAPLSVGAAVHLAPVGPYDPRTLNELIARRRITLLNATPSALYPLVELDMPREYARLASLRTVYLGGEPIAVSRLSGWLQSERCRAVVTNSYGPTECTDVVAYYRLARPELFLDAPAPIGGPIANTQLLVLDAEQRLVPIGAVGELCIAGACVGIGYLNDAALTAERFLPNPFAATEDRRLKIEDRSADAAKMPSSIFDPRSSAGARLYRTGDLVRRTPDGAIVFIGRIDDQVKVRGFRIELGEVEGVLRQHAAVQECAVLVREDAPGEPRLAAYIVQGQGVGSRGQASGGPAPDALIPEPRSLISELRAFAKARLPEYMVPSVFVTLDALPLTPSGKLDRRALPAPDVSSVESDYVAPRTLVEELLAQIWSDLLGRPQISITARFFDLGGHSLLVAQLIFRLRETFQVDLPLRALFEQPTIAELALAIEEQMVADLEELSEEEAQHLAF